MARIGNLRWLLLLNLLWGSNALACYCTTPWMAAADGRQYCVANAECWACVPGAYDSNWQSLFCGNYVPPAPPEPPPPTCQASTESQQDSCPANTSGTVVRVRQSTCPDPYGQPVWGPWETQSSCTPNPPTCQISSEAKTEACQAGFVGQKDFSRQSSCPDPYGQAIWGAWNLVSDSCIKSVTNPTNPLSPVSPVSPVNPMSAPVTPVAPVTAPMPVQTMTTETGGSTTESEKPAESAPSGSTTNDNSSTNSSGAQSPGAPATGSSAGNGARAAALVQRLTLIGALPPQPTIIETLTLKQELPNDIRRQQDFLVDLIANDDNYRAIGADQRARFGGILWSNPLQSGDDGN